MVTAIGARDVRAIAAIGWEWLRGDWLAAEAVTEVTVPRIALRQRRPVHALVDGEPHKLAAGTTIELGRSAPMFLSTLEAAAP